MCRRSTIRWRAPLKRRWRPHSPHLGPGLPAQRPCPRSSRWQAWHASRGRALRSWERRMEPRANACGSHHRASPFARGRAQNASKGAVAALQAPPAQRSTRPLPLRPLPELGSESATAADRAPQSRRCPTASRSQEHPAAGPRTSSATAANERAPRRRARSRAGRLRVGHARVRCDCLRRARQAAPASTSAATVAKNSNQRDSMRAQGVRRADRAPARRRDADYPVGRDAATPRALRRWRRCRSSGNASARATIAITTPLIGRVKNTVQSFW